MASLEERQRANRRAFRKRWSPEDRALVSRRRANWKRARTAYGVGTTPEREAFDSYSSALALAEKRADRREAQREEGSGQTVRPFSSTSGFGFHRHAHTEPSHHIGTCSPTCRHGTEYHTHRRG